MIDEILVVDDQEKTALRIAELIHRKTGFGVVHTSNPQEAVELLQSLPIKVAVLDQRMPEKSGTELSVELREVNESLRVIMFTGEASPAEVADATLRKNFNDVLQKADIERLGEVIFEQYVAYEIEVAKRVKAPIGELFRTPRQYRLFGPQVVYSLLDLRLLRENYIPNDGWDTFLHLTRGQEEKRSSSWTTKYSVTIERQSQETFKANARARVNNPLGHLQASLERTISEQQKEAVGLESTKVESREITYKLSDQEADVRSRHIQRAPVYRQWVAVIGVECDCCGSSREERIILDERLPAFATRHVDIVASGSEDVHFTGIVAAKYI